MAQPNSESGDVPLNDRMPRRSIRIALSVLIAAYLFLVVLGPLSNPVASANLTEPLARKLRPLHQALFIGHGYRFFGPDPGPSHILEYTIQSDSEDKFEGRFPDRDQYWPRLRYHRWFMLSESVYQECSSLPSPEDFKQITLELDAEIQARRMRGEIAAMTQLVKDRDQQQHEYETSTRRTDLLLRHIARYLLSQHPGDSIELFLRERLIAPPGDVASHIKLTDPKYISEPRLVGKFTAADLLPREEVE